MTATAKTVCFIFARAGSKGLPNKNLRELQGKPLIAHAIETALACEQIDRTIISTECDQIADIAMQYGAEALFKRPKQLAEDTSPEWLAWQHAVSWYRDHIGDFDCFVSLPPTAPLRIPKDVERCIDMLNNSHDTDIVITGTRSQRSPYFNMVTVSEDGVANLAIPNKQFSRRQDAPTIYDITTVAYAAKPEFILRSNHLFEGNARLSEVPQIRAVDIDTEFDLEVCKHLAQTGANHD